MWSSSSFLLCQVHKEVHSFGHSGSRIVRCRNTISSCTISSIVFGSMILLRIVHLSPCPSSHAFAMCSCLYGNPIRFCYWPISQILWVSLKCEIPMQQKKEKHPSCTCTTNTILVATLHTCTIRQVIFNMFSLCHLSHKILFCFGNVAAEVFAFLHKCTSKVYAQMEIFASLCSSYGQFC